MRVVRVSARSAEICQATEGTARKDAGSERKKQEADAGRELRAVPPPVRTRSKSPGPEDAPPHWSLFVLIAASRYPPDAVEPWGRTEVRGNREKVRRNCL
ncbi:MAG TPA: hypothetical protein DEP84_23590 [Chloroflexi bacterium]|nr:hypothetical protein [Chloroflexota bacterium]